MISLTRTNDGGMRLLIDSSMANAEVVWDASGVLISEKMIPASRGVGDSIAKVAKALGANPCKKCQDRQEKLNRLVPYK